MNIFFLLGLFSYFNYSYLQIRSTCIKRYILCIDFNQSFDVRPFPNTACKKRHNKNVKVSTVKHNILWIIVTWKSYKTNWSLAVICRWDTLSVLKCKLQNIHRITVTEHLFCYATKVLWQCGPALMLLQTLCSISYPLVNSNWSYSPESPNLGQVRRFLVPCDLEIWRMTLQNNRAPLLCYFKLCASFRTHWWIQTWVTVRKPSIRVKINDFFSRVT